MLLLDNGFSFSTFRSLDSLLTDINKVLINFPIFSWLGYALLIHRICILREVNLELLSHWVQDWIESMIRWKVWLFILASILILIFYISRIMNFHLINLLSYVVTIFTILVWVWCWWFWSLLHVGSSSNTYR